MHKIISTKILSNPFDDIVPRETVKKKSKKEKPKNAAAATKLVEILFPI